MRDRLKAGRRVLAPLIKVRILVPQPGNLRGYEFFLITPFDFFINLLFFLYFWVIVMVFKDIYINDKL